MRNDKKKIDLMPKSAIVTFGSGCFVCGNTACALLIDSLTKQELCQLGGVGILLIVTGIAMLCTWNRMLHERDDAYKRIIERLKGD